MHSKMTRREALGALLASRAVGAANPANTRQATGIRIGEVTPESAVIWTRRTAAANRLADGVLRRGHAPNARVAAPGEDVNRFEGACPGAAGYVRVRLEPASGTGRRQTLDWAELRDSADYAHQFRLEGLRPATQYRIAVETRATRGGREDEPLTGSFRTAPRPDDAAPVRFILASCQMYCRMDRTDGFSIYEAMAKAQPDFFLSCGDNVYYDSEDPVVNSVASANYHWQRMYSLATLHQCLRTVPGYWQNDDHDLYSDDCWPGMTNPKMAPFNIEVGRRVFLNQVPAPPEGQPFYRRFRWGRDLEIWLPESRDFRSPNNAPDTEAKTIWGAAQKKWLLDSLQKSDARWKFLINPNPMIGPDHARKNDNHANPAFATESRQFRQWLKDHAGGSVILVNGDRHWQYHSIDPDTSLEEFGCGPASDSHAVPPSRGEDPRYHRFLRIKGGYLAATVDPRSADAALVVEHCDVQGASQYRRAFKRRA
jgi:alkaline phosphatase D